MGTETMIVAVEPRACRIMRFRTAAPIRVGVPDRFGRGFLDGMKHLGPGLGEKRHQSRQEQYRHRTPPG